ncbi:MAG TPA: nuclear transport factor 2 family protein [Candidatus Elarobacter sp.]
MIASPVSVVDQFVHALGQRDFNALESAFAPEVGFRALVPPGLREARTRSEARQHYQRWFADLQQFEMVGHTITPVANRTHIAYRLRFLDEGIPKVCEQRIFVTTGQNGIEKFDLVCSGFLPRGD